METKMTNKKLIVKFKRNVQDKETMLIYDEEGEYIFRYGNAIENIIALSLKCRVKNIVELIHMDLSNFEYMIQKGYIVELTQNNEKFVLTISKGTNKKTYTANSNTLVNMLVEANWDYESKSEREF